MRRFGILALLAAAVTARAEIVYHVKADPDAGLLHVTIHLDGTQKGSKFQIPNWTPGAYSTRDTFKLVQAFKATDAAGNLLSVENKIDKFEKPYVTDSGEKRSVEYSVCTWVVSPAKSTTVTYDMPLKPVAGAMHWSGPSTYMYEVGRKKEGCRLEVEVPAEWPVFTGLDESKKNTFTAKDYDTLADNPVSTGDVIAYSYLSRSKVHWIVMRGAAKAKVDKAKLLTACKFVSDAETDFFGGKAPYNKYVWHFDVFDAPDGAGGLEHLSSTQISLSSGVGPRAVGVLAHEFFHLWNVKRIRSKPLGPFDYTKLPETGALWWLEGVTDYYAFTLLHRYGWMDDASYFATIASNYQTVKRNRAFDIVGPNESSMRVGEANGGRGNSNGYRISYYDLGWLAGMCLDIELRQRSGGKASLDNVELALWNMCKDNKPGFGEDEIRKQMVRFGGAAMGPVYDRIVMKPSMPVEEALAKVGLQATNKPESFVDTGFSSGGGPGAQFLTVAEVHGATASILKVGDRIVEVDGKKVEGTNGRERSAFMAAALRGALVDKPITLAIIRGEQPMTVEVRPFNGSRDVFTVERSPSATPQQKALGDAWLAGKKF